MLLNAILETHAWASTRLKHESSIAAQSIEQKIVSVMETEKEQGMSLSPPQLSSLYIGIFGRHHSLRLLSCTFYFLCWKTRTVR